MLVLAAIIGALIAIDRRGGSELGPLDSRAPEVGELAPQFALRDTDGNVRELSDYRGKVVWINFWATWCGPCRRELPDIQRIADAVGEDDLVVLALNQEEPADVALGFWQELGLDLPILLDSDHEVSDQYRLFGLPNNFFIDRAGVLTGFRLGFLTEEQMLEQLATAGLDSELLRIDRD
ncbi:MAG: TlpA disulfide reductase family protein [Dehalococcoidia bacterium]